MKWIVRVVACWMLTMALPSEAALLFSTNTLWQYFKGRVEPSTPAGAWRTVPYDDSSWSNGPAFFYYGESLTGTLLSDMQGMYSSLYLRRKFVVTNISEITSLKLDTITDDGHVVWINGVEVARFNVPAGDLAFNAIASSTLEMTPNTYSITNLSFLVAGTNVVAVQALNGSLAGSSDFVFAAALSTTAPDPFPPTIAAISPTPGTLNDLTQITVTFSEPVSGVDASDLRINGVPATAVSGADDVFTFTFAQPAYGNVQISWAGNHGIADFGIPPNPFNATAPGATWQYNLVDNVAPTVLFQLPFAGVTIRSLAQIEVTFSEAVTGVDAADLRINGNPATSVTAQSPSLYVFQFPSQPAGPVQVTWAPGHGIRDLFSTPNAFAGAGWSYVVDPTTAVVTVRLNELVAANVNGLRDEDNEPQDWVELYNSGSNAVSLAGWSLSDNPDASDKWIFPPVSLAARGYLLVFCSAKDRKPITPGSRLHTNFKLNPDGEFLGLYNAEVPRQLVSSFDPYPNQRRDYSYGYDVANQLRYFQTPTPNAANPASLITGVVADTRFSHDRGFYTNAFSLTITCATPGVTIRWTRDGTEPTATAGFIYTNTIQVTGTTTIRAAAFKTGLLPSDVDCQTYLFLSDVITQSANRAPPPGWPASWGANTVDYGMDPRVVTNALYRNTIRDDLRAIPTFSIVMKLDDLFNAGTGIYANPGQDGIAWERPCSIELIYPDGGTGFQVNCGIRIRGGFSRATSNPKHAFRLFFRQEYGVSKLNFPVFGVNGAQSFDKFDLRTLQNYSWSFQGDGSMICLRDQMSRDIQLAMGQQGARGDWYHLYINGQYWGLYNTEERPEASFGESYFGGREEDYDVIKVEAGPYTINATDGDMNAWTRLWRAATNGFATDDAYFRVQGLNVDETPNPAYENLLDVDNLIDYMLVILWGGNLDAPISNFLGNDSPNNWYGMRNRTGLFGGFRFMAHDSEHTLLDVNSDRTGPYNAGDPTRQGAATALTKSNPQYIWQRLQANAEFRLRVADRLQMHAFNGGALSVEKLRTMYLARSNEINRAIVGESARWGDAKVATPYTRDTWLSAIRSVYNNFLLGRTAVLLNQMRTDGLFPAVVAPVFSRLGGLVPPGFNLYLTNTTAGATIYYTLDGTDPRQRGGAIAPTALAYTPGTPITINAATLVRARARSGTAWSARVQAQFYPQQDFTRLLVTEIMYNPPDVGATNGNLFEFIELKNAGTKTLDVSGLMFTAGINFTFTNGSRLAPGEIRVLVSSAANFRNKYAAAPIHGVFTGSLNNGGETITLSHPLGGSVFSFGYKDSGRWPITPDGFGYSLVSRDPNSNPRPGDPVYWRASTNPGGSPGTDDPAPTIPGVVVNEVLTHTDLPTVDAIELHNPTTRSVNIGGWFLTDDAATPKKFRIPDGTTIDAGGYEVFTEADFNSMPGSSNSFSLSSTGDEAYLFSGDANTNLTGYSHGFSYGAAANGVSFGRYVTSTGEEEYPAQISVTLGSANSGPRVGPVVIRQIMYHPPDLPNGADNSADEFVQLINISGAAVDLFDASHPTNAWRVRGGIGLNLPPNTTLPAGGSLLLVNIDPANPVALAAFRSKYGGFSGLPLFGPYSGRLNNDNDAVELQRPDTPDTNGVPYILVDEVRFRDSAPWPPSADGSGASLLRVNNAAYGNDPANWIGFAPLQIVRQPQTVTASPGGNATLTVLAAGTGNLRYQWRKDGVALTGETNDTLTITSVQEIHDGLYEVMVTDNTGSLLSAGARINVLLAPAIVEHPLSQTVVQGGNVTLSVRATGNLPMGFHWRRSGTRIFGVAQNSRTAFYTITNIQADVSYTVIVTNAVNNSGVQSNPAQITVLADTDRDGLPDVWETANGLDPNSAADAALDSDGDTMTNGAEYIAGTNPRDAQSYLKVDDDTAIASGVVIRFNAVSNRTYSVEYCDALGAAPWFKLADVAASSVNRAVAVTNTAPASALRFYRLATPQKPQ